MPRATLAIQVVPLCAGDTRPFVDAAIARIQASGVDYEVGPLETTLEGGDAAELLRIAADAHRAALAQGAAAVQSNIRLLERPAGFVGMRERVAPFRGGAP